MKETIGNSHYQEKVSCLIEFVLPFQVDVSELPRLFVWTD